jgi:hypothetical protein
LPISWGYEGWETISIDPTSFQFKGIFRHFCFGFIHIFFFGFWLWPVIGVLGLKAKEK